MRSTGLLTSCLNACQFSHLKDELTSFPRLCAEFGRHNHNVQCYRHSTMHNARQFEFRETCALQKHCLTQRGWLLFSFCHWFPYSSSDLVLLVLSVGYPPSWKCQLENILLFSKISFVDEKKHYEQNLDHYTDVEFCQESIPDVFRMFWTSILIYFSFCFFFFEKSKKYFFVFWK